MVEQFEDKCSDQVRAKVRNQQTEDWYMVQSYYYALILISRATGWTIKGKSLYPPYWEKGAKGDGFLQVKGYEEFPILAPTLGNYQR